MFDTALHEDHVIETVSRFVAAEQPECVLVRIEMVGATGMVRLLDFRTPLVNRFFSDASTSLPSSPSTACE